MSRKPKIELAENFEFKLAPDGNAAKIIREIREYELITPLFGGGAKTKKADEISIVRATEIRGHLRFWWRATRGGQFPTVAEMKKAEDAIFGSTENHSAVQIEIEIISRGKDFPSQKDYNGEFQSIDSIKSPYSYISFPLRGEHNAKIIQGIEFFVSFIYPQNLDEEIKAAIWAWELFGGIGARTRRGFGAIQRKDFLPESKDITQEIQKGLEKYSVGNSKSRNFPLLDRNFSSYKITKKKQNSDSAWKYLFGKLKRFRQYRKDKFGNEKIQGKSQWSEPNALRYRMNKRSNRPSIDKFPRADFGLPILFEMKHDNFKSTLKGKGNKGNEFIERLSSSLILRPIKCSDGAIGIAVILNTLRIPPFGLVLTEAKKDKEVSSKLTSEEAKELSENLEPLNNQTDILQAFLNYLGEEK